MKKILVIIFNALFVMITQSYGQTGFVYADARTILTDKSTIQNIIAYYAGKPTAKPAEIDTIIKNNPFLAQSEILKKYLLTSERDSTQFIGDRTGIGSNLLGSDVTNFADGLAKFLIERGKQELSMAFFDKMREEFNKYPELKILFPLTIQILEEIENHNIPTLLQELKDAFTKDLLNSPTNILAMRYIKPNDCTNLSKGDSINCAEHNVKIDKLRKALEERRAAVPLLVAQGIINGNNIITILGSLATDVTFCEKTDDTSGYFKLTYVLLEMLRSSTSTAILINEIQLKELFTNEELMKLFLGLGYEKFNRMDCFKPDQLKISGATLESIFASLLSKRERFLGKVSSFDNLNIAHASLTKGPSMESNHYGSLVASSTLAIDGVLNGLSVVLNSDLPDDVRKLLTNLAITRDLVIDIHQRNYTGIFNDVIRFVEQNEIIDDPETKAKLVKYLSFGANIASAQNSDEVKAALDAATLPPGSFSVKQKSKFSIGINAYVGYAWDFKSGLYGRNVYAPLGVATSWGLNKGNSGAVSLFISVIDVGSLVAYRLNNSATDTLKQEVRLESIISPSAQVIYALPRLPLSICAGVRRTPKLVFEGQTEFRVVKPETVFNLSILIDIPLFNLKVTPHD